jgi:hypothetical protein
VVADNCQTADPLPFTLDDDFLAGVGLDSLSTTEKNAVLRRIYDVLETRVGTRLAALMSDRQLSEFEGFIDRHDEAGAQSWLEAEFPNYPDLVGEELTIVRRRLLEAMLPVYADVARRRYGDA